MNKTKVRCELCDRGTPTINLIGLEEGLVKFFNLKVGKETEAYGETEITHVTVEGSINDKMLFGRGNDLNQAVEALFEFSDRQ